MMMKTVRNTFHSIGDHGSDAAKAIGSGTAGFAMRIGSGTAGLAKRIGPKRGLIGLAVLGVAIGGTVVLLRYLRTRADSELDSETFDGESKASNKARKRARGDRSNHAVSTT